MQSNSWLLSYSWDHIIKSERSAVAYLLRRLHWKSLGYGRGERCSRYMAGCSLKCPLKILAVLLNNLLTASQLHLGIELGLNWPGGSRLFKEIIFFEDASKRPKDFVFILTERHCALNIPASGEAVLSTSLDHGLLQ